MGDETALYVVVGTPPKEDNWSDFIVGSKLPDGTTGYLFNYLHGLTVQQDKQTQFPQVKYTLYKLEPVGETK